MAGKNSFNRFKEKAQHKKDELLTITTLDPISIRLAYFIKKYRLNILPNDITRLRLFIFSPLTIIFLLLAPIFQVKLFYLFVPLLIYLIVLSDDLDGNLARGTGKTSKLGAFLDTISDRFLVILFFTSIFSVGLWTNNIFLSGGAVLLFVLKTFHMMVITKIFYYSEGEEHNLDEIFSGEDSRQKLGVENVIGILKKVNSFLKIKRWNEGIGGYERAFLTTMLPSLLIFFNQNMIVIIIEYFFIIFFALFFIIRIKNLLKTVFTKFSN